MKYNIVLITAFVLLITFTAASQSQTYFIKYNNSVSSVEIENKIQTKELLPPASSFQLESEDFQLNYFAKGLGKKVDQLSRIIKVSFKNEIDETSFLSLKNYDPDIDYIQPANNYKIDFVPDDSLVTEQWGLEKIQAFNAWDITTGSDSVLLAIIDTGIDYEHPELVNQIFMNPGENGTDQFGNPKRSNGIDDDGNGFIDDYMGWDFTDRVGFPFDTSGGDYLHWDNDPYDDFFHGTFVAGIAAAETNNNRGIAGTAPDVKILNLRAFDPIGIGEEDDVAAAILYAIDMGAKVINMSFGDYSFSYVLRDVIRYAYSQDIVMVASAGNSNSSDPHYPSGYSEVISVANTTQNDVTSSTSNYGSTIDLSAPGTAIISTTVGGGYRVSGGTSASAPFVSGTAGLLLSLRDFNNEEVKQILKSTSDDIMAPGWDIESGAGRLNTYKAVSVLAPANISINHPFQDFTTNENSININATVLSPYFESFDLLYGTGLNPTSWTNLLSDQQNQISNEDIYQLDVSGFQDTSYALRLLVHLNNGSTTEERLNFYIDRTPPDLQILSDGTIYYGNQSTVYAEVITNKRAITRMYYRKQGTGTFNFITLDGFATNNQFVKQVHFGFIPVNLIDPNTTYEVYYETENLIGITKTVLDEGSYFEYTTDPIYEQMSSIEQPFSLPRGTLYRNPVNFLSNNNNEVLFNKFYESSDLYYSLYTLQGNNFVKHQNDSLMNKKPRDVGDFNNNGKEDLLSTILRYGYLSEQTSPNSFSFTNTYSDSTGEFFALTTDDIDNDGITEVVSIYKDTALAVYKINNNLTVTLDKILLNFSDEQPGYSESNFLTRNITIADLNGDGQKEIWFIDMDGDVCSYNVNGPGSYSPGIQIVTDFRSRYTNTLKAGDFTGDGVEEMAVLFYSNFIAPYHALLVFKPATDGLDIIYEKSFIDQSAGFGSLTFADVQNSIRFADLDNDNIDELILSVFPNTYIVKNDAGEYDIKYFAEGTNLEEIFVGDLNANGVNEVGIQFEDGIKFLEFTTSLKPPAPTFLTGFSIDSSTVHLEWYGLSDKYYIYKGSDENNLSLFDSTNNVNYTDNLVENNTNYYYQIQAYDPLKEIPLSNLTPVLEVYSHEPAQVISVTPKSARSVLVKFSGRVKNTIENLNAFEVIDFGIPNSVSPASQFSYLLTFKDDLPLGENSLVIQDLRDFYNSPIEVSLEGFFVNAVTEEDEFFISSHEIINPYKIKVEFNLEVDPDAAGNVDNYIFNPDNKASSITVDEEDNQIIYVNLKGNKPVGSIGIEYTMEIENLRSSQSTGNLMINEGAGSFIVLTGFAEDLSDVYVYPNPATVRSGEGKLTFANLPQRAKITILNLSGKQIINLEENDGDGGVDFNLRDSRGELLNSGVYIYRIVRLDENRNEVEEKIGKFAVIR